MFFEDVVYNKKICHTQFSFSLGIYLITWHKWKYMKDYKNVFSVEWLDIVFNTPKMKFISSSNHVIVFLLYSVQRTVKTWEVISLISSLLGIYVCHLGPGCSLFWILQVVYLPMKHLEWMRLCTCIKLHWHTESRPFWKHNDLND